MTAAPPVSADDIRAAAALIEGFVRETPVLRCEVGGVQVTLKLEHLQHAGSFKTRGAFANVLSQPTTPTVLVAASGGNHGLAVAHVGAALGIETHIFVPEIASAVKVAAIEARGATVHRAGANYAAALRASERLAQRPGALAIHAYDAPLTLAGQGTVALELSQQAPTLDTVVVAVGGGGLIGGIASWYADTGSLLERRAATDLSGSSIDQRDDSVVTPVRIVSAEPHECPAMHDALRLGHQVTAVVGGVAADALGASKAGELGLAALQAVGATAVLVTDDEIMSVRQRLWTDLRLVVEPAGAVALAAVLAGRVEGDEIGVVLCGANTDASDLR